MYTSSRVTEMEHGSASACLFEESSMDVTTTEDGQWHEPAAGGGGGGGTTSIPVVSLKSGTTIRVSPMERKCGGWDDEHFHETLRLPMESNVTLGMVVTFEAMGRECVAIALSPKPYFEMGKTYVAHFGAGQNLSTVLRRRLANGTQSVDVSFPTPRICEEYAFQKYWILLQQNGQLSVGVGAVPGRQCVGTLDDQLYHYLRHGQDAVRYVGIGNSALGKQARDIKVRNIRVMSIPPCFHTHGIPLLDRTTLLSTPDQPHSQQQLQYKSQREAEEDKLWAEYVQECNKAKARAAKFGTEYTQPAPDAFFKWSEARRLRSNPERGFITGLDTFSQEEQIKAAKRKQRFQDEDQQFRMANGTTTTTMETTDTDNTTTTNTTTETKKKQPWNVEQAWDNERKIRKFRTDPPSHLLIGNTNNNNNNDPNIHNVTWVPEKIHIFAIDWAAFKQIRTDDLMAYFSIYGPTYVEWLGELSCNVLFEDKYSAARAVAAMSQEIPTFEEKQQNDNHNTNMAEEEISEDMQKMNNDNRPDLGALGWRFCNFPVRKIANDRFGRRGTRSRLLMRLATSVDILEERPKDRSPKPPGFSTTRILGPHMDRRKMARKQGKRRKMQEDDDADDADDDDSPALLSRGLSSTRPGFSVEELEKERNAKAKKDASMQDNFTE